MINFSASSAFGKNLDLKQAIALARENNLQLKSALEDKSVRLHELKILKKRYYPQLTFNVELTAQNEDYFNQDFVEKKLHTHPALKMLTPIGTQIEIFTEQNIGYEQNAHSTGSAVHIVFEQPLLQGSRINVNNWVIENAKILNEIEELLLKRATDQLVYNVITGYHALLLSQQNINLQERFLIQAQRFYEILKTKVMLGRAAESDLASVLLQVNTAKSNLAQAKYESHQAMRKFLQLIGSEEEIILNQAEASEENKEFIIDSETFLQLVEENDIESKVINLNKERVKKQLKVVKDKLWLDVKLRGDWTLGRYHVYGDNNADLNSTDTNLANFPFIHQDGNYSAHLLLNIPFSQKEEKYHQIYATLVQLHKIEDELIEHHQELSRHVEGLLEFLELKKQQIALAVESVKLAQKNYDDIWMKLEAGRASVIEMSLVQEKLLDSKVNYHAALIAYLDLIANLEFTAGIIGQKWL